MLKGTRKFQTIMNSYRKYQYEKSKIPGYNFKNKTSLNNRFIEELNRVKRHQNFSDLEYMINEIKIENKKQKSNKVFEVTGKENNFERGRFVKNEKITKEAFFFSFLFSLVFSFDIQTLFSSFFSSHFSQNGLISFAPRFSS